MTRQDASFDGWESYPQNLQLSPVEVCAKDYDKRLSQVGKRLFVEPHESEVRTIELGPVRHDELRDVENGIIGSSAQLRASFETGYPDCIFLLHQSYSWGRLQVSEPILRELFTGLQVHPEFLEILFLFGEKLGPTEESFSSFCSHCRPVVASLSSYGLSGPLCSYDIGYNIKYAAPHMRTFPKDPYSLRETGVYHSFDARTQKAKWVFIQSSAPLEDRLKRCFSHPVDTHDASQFKIHGVILQTALNGWRDYLVYLEDTFSKLSDQGFHTRVSGPRGEGDLDVDFSDIRSLRALTAKMRRLLQIISLNVEVAERMRTWTLRVKSHSPHQLSDAFDDLESTIQTFIMCSNIHCSRLSSMMDRGREIQGLIQSMLEARTNEGSNMLNNRMARLAEISADENRLIAGLTYQTTRDTRAMSTISFISAVFLPATFLATMFGMNFFAFAGGRIIIATNFWIYIIMAACSSGVTVTIWYCWQRRIEANAPPYPPTLASNMVKI
ncbi:hypothetical protein BDW42DRAFT_31437 [Aspergillus taichungensis]|uniref:CorA-like transporter domain-containing protein n=1 Tax=Aspergillus taichungensis TaxID=482145 RepID=A0A2J5I4F0_9EURO|nr:hypothetical protein BDW42DRAFT_31437 [Aspergillus taichungensis]